MSIHKLFDFLNFASIKYVYARETRRQMRDEVEFTSIVMHSVLRDSIPHVNGVIRVNDYHQSIVMTRHGTRGSRSELFYGLILI